MAILRCFAGLVKGPGRERAFLGGDMVFGGAMTSNTRGGVDDESEEMSMIRWGLRGLRNHDNFHAENI